MDVQSNSKKTSVGEFQPSRDTPNSSVPITCEVMCHCLVETQACTHNSPLEIGAEGNVGIWEDVNAVDSIVFFKFVRPTVAEAPSFVMEKRMQMGNWTFVVNLQKFG